jgi:hypothetical protein
MVYEIVMKVPGARGDVTEPTHSRLHKSRGTWMARSAYELPSQAGHTPRRRHDARGKRVRSSRTAHWSKVIGAPPPITPCSGTRAAISKSTMCPTTDSGPDKACPETADKARLNDGVPPNAAPMRIMVPATIPRREM